MTCSSAAWTSTPASNTDTNKSKRNALGAFLFHVQERRVGHDVGNANGKTVFGAFFGEETVDKQAKRDIMNQELNSFGVDRDEYAPTPCKESRRLVRGGEGKGGKSPWSLLLKDDASRCGRVTGVIPSACVCRQ